MVAGSPTSRANLLGGKMLMPCYKEPTLSWLQLLRVLDTMEDRAGALSRAVAWANAACALAAEHSPRDAYRTWKQYRAGLWAIEDTEHHLLCHRGKDV